MANSDGSNNDRTLWRPAPHRPYTPREASVTSTMMKAVRNRENKAEVLLRRALWARGFRYRLYASDLAGKPDIVFRPIQAVVFVDGDFWHGRGIVHDGLDAFAATLRTHRKDWWLKKLSRNVERDEEVTAQLEQSGWTVIRVWESDVLSKPTAVVARVARILRKLRMQRERKEAR